MKIIMMKKWIAKVNRKERVPPNNAVMVSVTYNLLLAEILDLGTYTFWARKTDSCLNQKEEVANCWWYKGKILNVQNETDCYRLH